jgi:hypothetical protein
MGTRSNGIPTNEPRRVHAGRGDRLLPNALLIPFHEGSFPGEGELRVVSNWISAVAVILLLVFVDALTSSSAQSESDLPISLPNGIIELIAAPSERFDGRIFFINDWDGGDADNQNAAEELNRNSKITQDVTILGDVPGRKPRKVDVDDLV